METQGQKCAPKRLEPCTPITVRKEIQVFLTVLLKLVSMTVGTLPRNSTVDIFARTQQCFRYSVEGPLAELRCETLKDC